LAVDVAGNKAAEATPTDDVNAVLGAGISWRRAGRGDDVINEGGGEGEGEGDGKVDAAVLAPLRSIIVSRRRKWARVFLAAPPLHKPIENREDCETPLLKTPAKSENRKQERQQTDTQFVLVLLWH